MDDLLDLNWGTGSSSGSGTKAAAAASSRSPAGSYSAFDALASSGSNGFRPNYTSTGTGSSSGSASYRPPSAAGNGTAARPASAASRPNTPAIKASGNGGMDAFDSLFTTASSGSQAAQQSKQKSMTIAERLDQQRNGGYGSSIPINAGVPQKTSNDPWDFDLLSAPASSSPSAPMSNRPSSPFDDLLGTPAVSGSGPSHTASISTADENDDLLGLLGKPVFVARASSPALHAPQPSRATPPVASTSSSSTSTRPPSRAVAARTPSPPPHILGQVVSMGFSVQQAKLALAATLGSEKKGQWNIEGALEVLASDGAATAQRQQAGDDRQRSRTSSQETSKGFRDEADEVEALRELDGPSARQRQRQAERRQGASANNRSPKPSQSPSQDEAAQSDLIAQASTIGMSMWKGANAYWKSSRAQIEKTLQEKKQEFLESQERQAQQESRPKSRTQMNGASRSARPKWMTEDLVADDDEDRSQSAAFRQPSVKGKEASFRDEDDADNMSGDGVLGVHPDDRKAASRPRQEALPVHPSERDRQPSTTAVLPPVQAHPVVPASLKPPEPERRIYSSPNRRKPVAVAASAPAPPAVKAKPSRPARTPVSVSPSVLAAAKRHRELGNEHFKLGRYGEAVEAYNVALRDLPDQHYFSRIPILNNRANARLKIGEERKAVEDASEVLRLLLGPSYASPDQAKREDWDAVIVDFATTAGGGEGDNKLDAPDHIGKALSRRARGQEASEKWNLAMKDWQVITELGDQQVMKSAGGIRTVSEGLARCRKAIAPAPARSSAPNRPPPPKPKPKPVPAPNAKPAPPSAAVTALREASVQQATEDAERIAMKDDIDARVAAWKGGKETNLRALVASLDTLLWPESGWKKVGMHELISESQLKVRYMRAIGKVHPDKLGEKATVEQKMIASAAFDALNHAWNASR